MTDIKAINLVLTAAYLKVSMKTLRRIGVKRVAYGKRTFRYRVEDLDNFIKARAA